MVPVVPVVEAPVVLVEMGVGLVDMVEMCSRLGCHPINKQLVEMLSQFEALKMTGLPEQTTA